MLETMILIIVIPMIAATGIGLFGTEGKRRTRRYIVHWII